MPLDGPSRFKSRFSSLSLFSLLPTLHPPLAVSHPLPPTQAVSHRPTIVPSSISPVQSQYLSPSTPPPPVKEERPRPKPSPRRPPPLDLKRTMEVYPSASGQNSSSPEREINKRSKKETRMDDPFEVAEVEPGHRYTEWKGGKVDIRPGQVVPRGLVGVPTARQTPDQYESVLHDVLLTPTYLHPSPLPMPTPTPSPSPSHPKRRTMIDRAANTIHSVARMSRNPRWVGRSILKHRDEEVGRSVKAGRETEERDMDRFRRGVHPLPTVVGSSYSPMPMHERSQAYVRRSPGHAELAGVGNRAEEIKCERGWRGNRKTEGLVKRRQKIWKYAITMTILCLAALTVGLCTSLLTRSSSFTPSTSSAADGSTNVSSSTSATPTASTVSQSLATCLNLFSNPAPTSPLAYPCSDCTPVLASATNDFSTPFSNVNATGVGAALQFCALMDVYRATGNGSGLGGEGWARDVSPCSDWTGITCDSRGRVTDLRLQYPNVPDKLPATLNSLVALQSLHIMGNSSVPTGAFPDSLLFLTNLTTLDIEYTGLTGPFSSVDFSLATGLTTLYLVNNQELGTAMPSLMGNSKLLTLAVTGQGLTNVSVNALPSTLTYLDLSFNSFSGVVPSFISLASLQTLYLQNNAFTAAPSSLPSSLSTLALTSNLNLAGNMPPAVCSSTTLTNCDLRSTMLGGVNGSTAATTTVATNATTSASGDMRLSSSAKVCGICRFS